MSKSRPSFLKDWFKTAAYGVGSYALAKGLVEENARMERRAEECKEKGLPSPRPFAQQTGDEQLETLHHMEKNGCRKAVGRYSPTGSPYPECVGGWEKSKEKDAPDASSPRPGKSA